MEEKKISVSRARRILGKSGEGLSDEQIKLLISQCYALAEVMFGHFKFIEKMKEVKKRNDES